MRQFCASLGMIATLCTPTRGQSADNISAKERVVFDRALIMTGLQSTRPPMLLTAELPANVSVDAEAWTVYDEEGRGDRIFVYTRSRTFRCASAVQRDQYQCLLKLASVIVHEAWHLKHGPDEGPAYAAQLAFLEFNHASASMMTEVRDSRRRVLADQRRSNKTGQRRAGADTPKPYGRFADVARDAPFVMR